MIGSWRLVSVVLALGVCLSSTSAEDDGLNGYSGWRNSRQTHSKATTSRSTSARFKTTEEPTVVAAIEKEISEKFSSGLYSYELRSLKPRIYEAYAALTFEFKRPKLTIPKEIRSKFKCQQSKWSSNGIFCPVMYWLQELEDELGAAAEMVNMAEDVPVLTDSEPFVVGSCERIKKHFRARAVSKQQLARYRRALKECVGNRTLDASEEEEEASGGEKTREEVVEMATVSKGAGAGGGAFDITREIERLRKSGRASAITTSTPAPAAKATVEEFLDDFVLDGAETLLKNMTRTFQQELYAFLPEDKRIDAAVITNHDMAAYSLALGVFLTKALVWKDALRTCSEEAKIPTSLLTPEELQASLKKLSHRLYKDRHMLAIPHTNSSIAEYYANRLGDCAVTKDTLFLRVLVPTKKYESRWRSVALTNVPFVYNDSEDAQMVCTVADSGNAGNYIYDLKTHAVLPMTQEGNGCDPRESLLCHTGEKTRSVASYRKTCFTEVIRRAPANQIKKLCPLQCDSASNFDFPIVVSVAPNVFYVAGTQEASGSSAAGQQQQQTNGTAGTFTGLSVKCSEERIEHFNFPPEGVMEIQLPCGCSLVHNKQTVAAASEGNCRPKMYVSLVKPMHLAPVGTLPTL